MSYTTEREEFIARMSREGVRLDVTRALLRYASTLQRLAVAQCNGDWPADNGERRTAECPKCGSCWAPSSFKTATYQNAVGTGTWKQKVCPDCYAESKVRAIVPEGWRPVFGGDPRGAVLRLVPAETPEAHVQNGRERGVYVPARER
jgi:hypothetical protein